MYQFPKQKTFCNTRIKVVSLECQLTAVALSTTGSSLALDFLLGLFLVWDLTEAQTFLVQLHFVLQCPDSLPYLSEWHTVPYSAYTQMKNTPMDQVFYWQLFLSYCSTVAMCA